MSVPVPDAPDRSRDPGPAPVEARPHRLRVVAVASAATVVVVFTVLALLLSEGGASTDAGLTRRTWTPADQLSLVGLGLVMAGGLLLLARPRVRADAAGARVRNVLGERFVPWGVVASVRFDDASPWAQLELHDDDVIGVLAVQANDGEAAFDVVDSLRALLAASRGEEPPARRLAGGGPAPA